ncbi:hypothetical protein HDU97_001944 [Phlyctochytrium planicorne]|nr:hypothetical protein HDU97_001944 [Phlyctochytrium planicorne]
MTRRKNSTDILMYLFAHSFNNRVRIYGNPISLDLQQSYDEKLGPAVTKTFLAAVMYRKSLAEKYLILNVHLNTWKALNRLLWPILKFAMTRHFDLSSKSIESARQEIVMIFEAVGKELSKDGGRQFICGNSLSAADISFSSHAALVLFPNEEEDSFGSKLGLRLPSLKDLPKEASDLARKLRTTIAGKHALKMYRKERTPKDKPDGFRSFPSKHSKEANPWWSRDDGELLLINTYGCLLTFGVITLAVMITMPLWAKLLFIGCQIAASFLAYVWLYKNSTLETRIKQLAFAVFGKHMPTERDLLEQRRDSKVEEDRKFK